MLGVISFTVCNMQILAARMGHQLNALDRIADGCDNWPDGREACVTNGLVTAIGMWGFPPDRVTGGLVFYILSLY